MLLQVTTDACSGCVAIFGPTCKSCQRIHGAIHTPIGSGIIWPIVVSHEWRFSAKIVDHDHQPCQSGGQWSRDCKNHEENYP